MHALSAARKTLLLHNYSGNSIRKAKTDKKYAVRIAQYALDRWLDLREYIPDDEIRRSLKLLNRQYTTLCKVKTMLNARTRGECEEKLAAMIAQVKADIKAEKERLKTVNESFSLETQ